MIVKNEAKNLEKCLNSVKDCVDEIILVDTGSTDRTKDIAKQFNAEIYDYEWSNDFSAARNFGLQRATKEMALYLDADEVLTSASQKILNKLKNSIYPKAYYCKIINVNHHTNRPSVMTYPRIFPNMNNIRFDGKVHEQIIFSLQKNSIEILHSDIEIIHSGYDLTDEELKIKAKRNLEILLLDYADNPSSYDAFQIGQSYNILENQEEAEKYFLICLRDRDLPKDYKSTALRVLSHYSIEKLDIQKAFGYIEEAIKYKPNSSINILQRARLFAAVKDKSKCFLNLKTALNLSTEKTNQTPVHLQEILITVDEILEEGLKYSLQFEDEEQFESFLENYRIYSKMNLGFIKFLKEIRNQKITDDQFDLNFLTEKQSDIVLFVLMQNEDFNEHVYDKLEKKFPNNFRIKKDYGLRLFKQQKYILAEEKFSQAEKLNPRDISLEFFIISTLLIQGKNDMAKLKLSFLEKQYSFNEAIQNQIRAIRQRLDEN